MASPQKENGYTAIANEIMDALMKYRLSGEEVQVLLCILRESYGWNRKNTTLSYGDIAEKTGMDRRHVQRAICKLSPKMVIGVTKNGDRCKQTYVFNKNYDEWEPIIKKVTVPKNGDRSVPKNGDSAPIYKNNKTIYSKFLLKNGEFYTPENDFIETLKTTFPDVDFQYEFKKISVWCLSNPEKRKTPKGARKFITSWMTRVQDKINESKPKEPKRVYCGL